jgi:hypothetical protein
VTDLTCTAANPPVALSTDERGASRAGMTDIGAYEVNNAYVAVLPSAFLNQPYNFTLTSSSGGFNYIVVGSLPPGIVLAGNAAMASFTGTPTQAGTFNFQINVNNNVNSALVNYSLTVVNNQASVSVGGRVTTAAGEGVPNVLVIITDSTGNSRMTRTGSFGYFRFDEVATGQTYTVSVASKQYQFQPQMINVTDNVTNLNFTAQ